MRAQLAACQRPGRGKDLQVCSEKQPRRLLLTRSIHQVGGVVQQQGPEPGGHALPSRGPALQPVCCSRQQLQGSHGGQPLHGLGYHRGLGHLETPAAAQQRSGTTIRTTGLQLNMSRSCVDTGTVSLRTAATLYGAADGRRRSSI